MAACIPMLWLRESPYSSCSLPWSCSWWSC
jgi:hypothetical protein